MSAISPLPPKRVPSPGYEGYHFITYEEHLRQIAAAKRRKANRRAYYKFAHKRPKLR